MGFTPHEGAEKILDLIGKAEGFIVKPFANDITLNSSYAVASLATTDFRLLTTETSWGGWGTSTSHRTLSTNAWATATTMAGEAARSTAANLTWTFTTIFSPTTLRGKASSASTTITELAGATALWPGYTISAATNILSTAQTITITSIPTSNTITISGTPSTSSSGIEFTFYPRIYGHVLIGSSSSKIYRVVTHEGFLPTKYGDYYTASPVMVIMED